MDMQAAQNFFMWCSIINGGMLIFSFLFVSLAGNLVYRIHSRMFPMSKESFNVAIYCFFGAFKLAIIVFNVVPYLALLILTCQLDN